MAGPAGDGFAFFTIPDSISIQYDAPGEAIRLEREARRSRLKKQDLGNIQPLLLERAAGPASQLPALGTQNVSAIMVNVAPGVDPARVAKVISGWNDVTVYPNDAQRDLMLKSIERNRKQLGMFRKLLVIISAIIMALILYTLTLDKIHDIAMLKLMGARNRTVVALILQQAMLLGALGYGLAYCIGLWVFPFFPRRVSVTGENLVQLALIVLAISVLSSLLGIWKAMSVQPNEILS
jgi:putative ABC transport system permease protein